MTVGAVVGAAVSYTAQVYNNYQNGYTGTDIWTQDIDTQSIVTGALVGAGAVVAAPVVMAAAGDVLAGTALATGSTTLMEASIATAGTATAVSNFLYGTVSGVGSASPIVTTAPKNDSVLTQEGKVASPDFVVSTNGDVIPVPNGATGPSLTNNSAGVQYNGGSGGNGLDFRVTNVRIMDPTPRYPNGYVSYSNGSGQAVNPFTGQTIARTDPWWHIPLSGDK